MIGLVNLSKPFDYVETESYASDIQFLDKHNIPFIDYAGGRLSHQEKLDGFHEALNNPAIDTIRFISGGIELISYLHEIDRDLVKVNKKDYIGLSDFTNFAITSFALGVNCYYGLGLKEIQKFYPEEAMQQRIVNFLKTKETRTISKYPVIGGHLIVTTLLLAQQKVSLKNKSLFIEHHYIPGERFYDLEWRINSLLYVLHENKPEEIILGNTMLYNEDRTTLISIEEINAFIISKLSVLNLPITYVNHMKEVIKMG